MGMHLIPFPNCKEKKNFRVECFYQWDWGAKRMINWTDSPFALPFHWLHSNSLAATGGNEMVTGPREPESPVHNRNELREELTGFCEPYRGSVCSQFIGNASIYVLSPYSQDQVEAKLSAAFTVVATSHDVSPQCHRFAIPSLCFGAFPLCDEYSHDPRPRKVSCFPYAEFGFIFRTFERDVASWSIVSDSCLLSRSMSIGVSGWMWNVGEKYMSNGIHDCEKASVDRAKQYIANMRGTSIRWFQGFHQLSPARGSERCSSYPWYAHDQLLSLFSLREIFMTDDGGFVSWCLNRDVLERRMRERGKREERMQERKKTSQPSGDRLTCLI